MKRLHGPWVVVAVLLAVLLPIEQAHCLLMPLQAVATQSPRASSGAMGHGCCVPSPAAQPEHGKAPAACPCIELPAGTVPQVIAAAPQPISPELAVLVGTTLLAAPRAALAPAPAPDIGSPALPIACDAHGLRAPPLSA